MSKKFSKVPQGNDFGSFLVFGNDDWDAIEFKTGYKMSQEVRKLLALATLFLTTRLAQEKSAPRLDQKNQKIIQKLKSLQ